MQAVDGSCSQQKPRANPEGLKAAVTPPAPPSTKVEDKPRPLAHDIVTEMEDVKSEPRSPPSKPQELPPEIAARIAEAERIAAEAEAEAAAYAEHAAAIQAEHDLQQQEENLVKGSKVQSFSKFQAELRAQQRQKQHKHKHERKDKRHKSDKHQAASTASQSSRAESHADSAQIKEQVAGYVAELLKPRFKANSISKEGYKWVVRKTVEKVAASATGSAGGEFLTEPRKAKIGKVVEHYVSQHKHEATAAASNGHT